MGFAIPSNAVGKAVPQLIQYGKIIRPSLRIQVLVQVVTLSLFSLYEQSVCLTKAIRENASAPAIQRADLLPIEFLSLFPVPLCLTSGSTKERSSLKSNTFYAFIDLDWNKSSKTGLSLDILGSFALNTILLGYLTPLRSQQASISESWPQCCHSFVSHGYFAIQVASEQLRSALQIEKGALVQAVEPNSNAAKAGLLGTRRTLTGISSGRILDTPSKQVNLACESLLHDVAGK